MRSSRLSGPPLPKTVYPPMPADARSSTKRWSVRLWLIWAISWMVRSSPARNSGMVVTATAPALTTPNQLAASHGLFGARSSTRLPGTTPTWEVR